jgi:hypothetical protein
MSRDDRPGWSAEDLAALPYARFWNPALAPLPERALKALERGARPLPSLPGLAASRATLMDPAADSVSGYGFDEKGRMHVAIDIDMPGVTPAMIDWWFGWHGDSAAKYRLWHPEAHLSAAWLKAPPAGSRGRARYVGCTSIVDEYIGSRRLNGSIRFVPPAQLGFTDPSLDDDLAATVVCARTGPADAPVDVGWLAHAVLARPGGSVMRSRFWFGGEHVAGRGGPVGALAALMVGRILKLTESDARALLIHCAEEMQHLASFLPALYAAFRDDPVDLPSAA